MFTLQQLMSVLLSHLRFRDYDDLKIQLNGIIFIQKEKQENSKLYPTMAWRNLLILPSRVN